MGETSSYQSKLVRIATCQYIFSYIWSYSTSYVALEQLIIMSAQLYSRQKHDAAPHPDHARSRLDLYISTRGLENSCFMLLAFVLRFHGRNLFLPKQTCPDSHMSIHLLIYLVIQHIVRCSRAANYNVGTALFQTKTRCSTSP